MQQVGKYQLIRKLATGGMAEVFLVKASGPMGFEKTLVLKRILPHLAEEPTFVQMFLAEAKLAARLTHQHIVQIFDFGKADGAYFLAMEYIDGPSLRSLIKDTVAKGQALPPEVCARLISHACEGLAFAHDFTDPETGESQGIIHRDISPDNILLSRQGAVKVVDFGIAKAAGQTHRTESGVIKGKLAYMPPEQLRSKPLDKRVDVYALGVVLYELLTGRKPYVADSDAGLMQAILFEPSTPAVELRRDLPHRLLGILARALAKERERRYPDCHTFQSDLEEFILSVGKPVTTPQVAQLIGRITSRTDLPVAVPPSAPAKEDALPAAAQRKATQVTKVERPPATGQPTLVLRRTGTPPPSAPRAPGPDAGVKSPRHRLGGLIALVGGLLVVVGGAIVVRLTSPENHEPTPLPHAVEQPRPAISTAPPAPQPPPSSALPPLEDAGTRPGSVALVPADAGEPPPRLAQASSTEPSPSPVEKESPPGKPKPSVPALHKPRAMGFLELHTQPNTSVIVDGKEMGMSPLPAQSLSVGRHHIQLINQKLSKIQFDSFDIKQDQIKVLTIDLRKN